MKLPKRKKLAEYSLDDVADIYLDIANDLDTPEKLAEYYGISAEEAIALEFVSRCLMFHKSGNRDYIKQCSEQFFTYLGKLVLSGFIPPKMNKKLNK